MAKQRNQTTNKTHVQSSRPGGERQATTDSSIDKRQSPTKALWVGGLTAIFVFAITFAVFSPALQNQFVDWDDPLNFLENPHYRGLAPANIVWAFSTFHMGHYQPLTWLTLGCDASIARAMYGNELDPRPYHFTNNLLHAINASLVFLLALRLLKSATGDRAKPVAALLGAAAAGLFFGIHPLRVESVAWATERRDLLSGFCLLLATLAYFRAQSGSTTSVRWLCISIVLFVFSRLSKVIGVTLPVVLVLMDWYPLRRLDASPANWLKAPSRRVLVEKIPYFVLSFGFSLLASIGQSKNNWLMSMEAHPLPARILQSFYGLMFYVQKTIWPTNLLPLYQMELPLPYTQAKYVGAAGLVVVTAIVLIVFHRRVPWLLVAAAVYAIMLAPVLGLVQNGPQIVADRYSYLPCIPWAILGGAAVMLSQRSSRLAVRSLAPILTCAAIITLGAMTARQSTVWRTTDSLWTHTYLGDPNGLFARNGYGYALLQRGEFAQASELFRSVVSQTPDNDKAWGNFWNALEKANDDAGLEQALRQAVQATSSLPDKRIATDAHFRLGNLMLLKLNRFPEAVQEFQATVGLNPRHAQALTNLGITYERLNMLREAEAEYRQAISIDPNLYQPRFALAMLLQEEGLVDEAVEQFREVLRIRPDHARAAKELDALTNSPR